MKERKLRERLLAPVGRWQLEKKVDDALAKPFSDTTEAVLELIAAGKELLTPDRLKEKVSPLLHQEFGKIVIASTNGLLQQMGEMSIPHPALFSHPLSDETFQKFLVWAIGEDADSEDVFRSLLSRFKIDTLRSDWIVLGTSIDILCQQDLNPDRRIIPIGVQFLQYAASLAILLSATKDNPTLGQHAKYLEKEAQTAIVQAGIWLAIEVDPKKKGQGQRRIKEAIDGLWQATQGPMDEERQEEITRCVLAGKTGNFGPVVRAFEHMVNKATRQELPYTSIPLASRMISIRKWPDVIDRLLTVFPFLGSEDSKRMQERLTEDRYF